MTASLRIITRNVFIPKNDTAYYDDEKIIHITKFPSHLYWYNPNEVIISKRTHSYITFLN